MGYNYLPIPKLQQLQLKLKQLKLNHVSKGGGGG